MLENTAKPIKSSKSISKPQKKNKKNKAKSKKKLYINKQMRGGFNTQCKGNTNKRWELMWLIFMYG